MTVRFGNFPILPADLCGLIETYAKTASGLPEDSVFLTLAPERWHLEYPPSDQFVTLYPKGWEVWQSVVSGGGSSYTLAPGDENLGFDLRMEMTVFTRFNTDEQFRSSALLRDMSIGILGVATRLITAFQIWTALVPGESDPEQSYLREPARIISGPSIVPRDYNKTLWALLHTVFEFRHTTKLTTSLT